jgi:serine/threonine kinase 16
MQEVEIFERFKHKNILKMLAYTVVDSESSYGAQEYLLLLEYYSKGSLQDLIERMKKFSFSLKEDEILKMFVQICEALRLFHDNNPVLKHNDIKPHNVLLTPDNTPILMDFGSVEAARISAKNRTEALAMLEDASETSTPVYRAPELFDIDPHSEDLSIDEAVDIWALGCVLFAMAYHDNPFELAVARGGSLRLAVNNVRLDFPDDNQYSKQFTDLIKWILNPDPKQRPNIDQVIAKTNELLENLQ